MSKNKNNWSSKTLRTITSVLPVSKNREGQCIKCGKCCKLPNRCPYLIEDIDGNCSCGIYKVRPLNCRKYPRTEKECITKDTCGFSFK